MRLLVAIVVGLSLASAAGAAQRQPPPESTPGEAVFVVSGRGWGHGVGMSQYGAYGQAKEGRSYDEILAYYYTGTELGRAATKAVRVLLAEGRRAVTIASATPLRIRDAAGTTVKLPARPVVLTPDLRVPDAAAPLAGPLVIRPGKEPLSLDGRLFRGRFVLAVQDGFLRVVNHVGLEAYIQGVVADEMPHTWPAEALKAQAVAARSYALKNLVRNKPFDLYSDVRSQVYGGIAAEEPESTRAVQATAGRIVTYGGEVASTYYFSSSGGKTASALDVFGFAVPYLVSKPDPWDRLSPNHRWGPVLLGARTVQSRLALPARVLDASGAPTPSGRVRSLVVRTTSGTTSIPASLLRTRLELRSTFISVGVLRLDRPRTGAEFGTPLRLSGIARNVASPQLTSSADGVTWGPVGPLEVAEDGAAARVVTPTQATRYRIESGGVASQGLLVRVSPKVRLALPAAPGVLTGTVRPRRAGVSVIVERLRGTRWVRVGQAATDAAGSFTLTFDVVPGDYRARVAAAEGFAEGLSPVLTVEG